MVNASSSQSVFISYSRADKDFVSHLIADLQQQGINVWIDKRGLKPGTRNWEQALRDAISSSWAVILVASPDSRRSNYVQDELSIAEMYKRPIFPIWVAGKDWMDCIPMGMGKIQYVDARAERYTNGMSELVETLNTTAATGPVVVDMPVPPDFVPRNPYKGLAPFRGEDKRDFFGRDGLIATLVERIKSIQQKNAARFLAVVGPSGSGKSSVVMAGLLPRLQAGILPGSENWLYLEPMVPGAMPVKSLAITLSRALPAKSIKTILEDLEDVSGLSLLAQSLITRPESRVVLVIDQFEELFTQTANENERQQFIDLLTTAATEPVSSLIVILTLRADFYDRPMNYAAFLNLLKEHHEPIPPMSLADLRDVIDKPADLPDVRMAFDAGLVAELVFDVREQPGALPLLQFTLDQLFQHREGLRITENVYREIGGVRGALAKHAEAAFLTLPTDEHQRLARALFLRLIEPGATEQDVTRHRAAFSELTLPDAGQSQVIREAADHFVRARLLTTNQMVDTTTIEVSHEALIREWPRLADWLHKARDDVRRQKAISADAAEWIRQNRSATSDALYRGTVLEDAQAWAKRNVPSADEVTFIVASAKADTERRARDEAIARRVQNFERTAAILAVVGTLALIAMVLATLQAINAGNQSATAIVAQGQALARQQTSDSKAALAQAQVRVAGSTLTPIGATLTAVQDNLQAAKQNLITATLAQGKAQNDAVNAQQTVIAANASMTPIPPTLTAVAYKVDAANRQAESASLAAAAVNELAKSNTNTELAALLAIRSLKNAYVGAADTALQQAIDGLYTRQVIKPSFKVYTAIFSPNGEYILTSGANKVALLWDAQDILQGKATMPLRTFSGHTKAVTGVSFSPDGKLALTSSDDRTARLWDVASGQSLRTFNGHMASVFSVAFSPDGKLALTGSADHTARLWDVASGRSLRTFVGHTNGVFSVAFSPDGKLALTGSADYTARLWDVAGGQGLHTFGDHKGGVNSVAFSPDGKLALTGGDDNTARLWDVASGQSLFTLSGHTSNVTSVIFSLDGKQVLTGSADRTARLWDVASGQSLRTFVGHTNIIESVAFSLDGKLALTGSDDNTVRLWVTGGRSQFILSGHTNRVLNVAFSSDGKLALTGSADYTARLWDVASRQPLHIFSGHTDNVYGVAFSPDSRTIMTSSKDRTAQLWDVMSGQNLRTLDGHTNTVYTVVFSPDGKLALTGSSDGTARLWDVASGLSLRTFGDYTSGVNSVAFSPDGKLIITGSQDKMTRLWDAANGQNLRTFSGHTDAVLSVVFSLDGKLILTGSADGTARLWDVANGRSLHTFVGHTGGVASVALSPDGRLALTGSFDNTARLWDVASGQSLRTFNGHSNRVNSVAFSPDGKQALTGSSDGTARLWDVDYRSLLAYACTRVFRDFTYEERQFYGIDDEAATCPQFGSAMMPPTATLIPTKPAGSAPVYTQVPAYATAVVSYATFQAEVTKLDLLSGPQVAAPMQGSLIHDSVGTTVSKEPTKNVVLANFIAEARFLNPYATAKGYWDYGLFFRDQGGNEQYRLILRSNRSWELIYGINTVIMGGAIPNLNVDEGGSNRIRVIINGRIGRFFVNDKLVSTLDISTHMEAGKISVITGAYPFDIQAGAVTRYEGFTVWALGEILSSTAIPMTANTQSSPTPMP